MNPTWHPSVNNLQLQFFRMTKSRIVSMLLYASFIMMRGAYCNRLYPDVVRWSLVGHVREMWLNGSPEAYIYYLTPTGNPKLGRVPLVKCSPRLPAPGQTPTRSPAQLGQRPPGPPVSGPPVHTIHNTINVN